jgi:hypothetical protein
VLVWPPGLLHHGNACADRAEMLEQAAAEHGSEVGTGSANHPAQCPASQPGDVGELWPAA